MGLGLRGRRGRGGFAVEIQLGAVSDTVVGTVVVAVVVVVIVVVVIGGDVATSFFNNGLHNQLGAAT